MIPLGIKNRLNLIRQIRSIQDLRLLCKLLFISLKISLAGILYPPGYLVKLAAPTQKESKQISLEKIRNYIGLCIALRRRLGLNDTCLTHAILSCHILRATGRNAWVQFAAQKTPQTLELSPKMIGHCWVTFEDQKPLLGKWQTIFKYP